VLDLVKREGPVSADRLATALGLTAMGVRQHLYALSAEGLATHSEEQRPRGRPVKLWRHTPKADPGFADSHSGLAADLIAQARKAFGEDGLDKLLRLRTAEQQKSYRAQIGAMPDLKARLEALARIREREGYMAQVRPDGDGFLFVENHCPVFAAARLCTGLCREELVLFSWVLGPNVKVERVSHILAGAGRCAYRVTPA
jgi:predicted ArsR family transcriptional regulator